MSSDLNAESAATHVASVELARPAGSSDAEAAVETVNVRPWARCSPGIRSTSNFAGEPMPRAVVNGAASWLNGKQHIADTTLPGRPRGAATGGVSRELFKTVSWMATATGVFQGKIIVQQACPADRRQA